MLIRNSLLDSETAKLAKRRRAKPLAEDIKYKQKIDLEEKKSFTWVSFSADTGSLT